MVSRFFVSILIFRDSPEVLEMKMEIVCQMIKKSHNLCAYTGAGLSKVCFWKNCDLKLDLSHIFRALESQIMQLKAKIVL